MRYIFLLLGIFSWLLFLLFQAQGIYTGDSGDLVTAAALGGVPHPSGYPLYSLLGFIVSKLPIATVAWRVSLLSSLPHAVTVTLVAWLVSRLTGKRWPGVLAAATLAGNYLFFLYSVTPEVFALFDLFVILLIFLAYQWHVTRKASYFYWMSFVLGLSLSHHHVIIFLLPALGYFLWPSIKKKFFVVSLLFFVLGLLPYLYLPIAGRSEAIINWNRPVDWSGFWRLVTRADYGTFVSGGGYGRLWYQRFLSIRAFGEFLHLDFTVAGVILGILGAVWLIREPRMRRFGVTIVASFILLGPLFLSYASFPLLDKFSLGTYERFLLPAYVIFAALVGLGASFVVGQLEQYLKGRLKKLVTFARTAFIGILFLLPVSAIGITVWRTWGLAQDRTAENLARDILASAPANAILLLVGDTPLFTTQYVRYVLRERPDVAAIHTSRLAGADYRLVLAKHFPDLTFPEETQEGILREFLLANAQKRPIVANTILPGISGWFWVPEGLLYRLAKQEKLPSVEETLRINENLWQRYQDPRSGILARYPHLMLADVVAVYAGSRVALGKVLLRAGKYREAREQFMEATNLGSDSYTVDALTLLGITELFLKHCEKALGAFVQARKLAPPADSSLTLYEALTWRDCAGDEQRAAELFAEYEKLRREAEIPLEKL